jgi:HD-like signal output (HDOD) protein
VNRQEALDDGSRKAHVNTYTTEDMRSRLLVARLPSLPQTLLKLLRLCQSEDVGLKELAELIAHDPALSAKVLAVAHSAAYHRADAQALTLLQATNRLGTALIKVLVISEIVLQTFNGFNQVAGTDLRAFWKHSLNVALIAKELAPLLDYPSPEEAYLAGLLHNIGRLALLAVAPRETASLFDDPDDAALCERERTSLGMTHTEAGAWLLGRWHVSDQVVASARLHHDPEPGLADAHNLARLIHLAHRLAALPLDDPDAAAQFVCAQGLGADKLLAVTQSASRLLEQVARDLGIDISATGRPTHAAAPVAPARLVASVQSQLAQEVFDRSVLNEMAMTLIAQDSLDAALTQLRHHASALLQLEDSVVMLLRSHQQQLEPASMNERHHAAGQMSYDLSNDGVFAACVATRKVVFCGRSKCPAIALLDSMGTEEMVLVPLLSARNCLGVLVAAVPTELGRHLHSQTAMLQAFGTYAGLALSRRRQATMSTQTLSTISRQEQRLGLMRMAQALGKQASPLGSADVCLAVKDLVQSLQDKRLVPGNVKIHCQLADQATLVRASLETVQLMALVLISNAFERMVNGGVIAVNAGALAYRHGARFTALTLTDTAASSEQAIQAQLHEPPHLTNTNDALSHSLGDAMRLVDGVAGQLSFKAGDSGTRFDILLPNAKQPQSVA